LLKEHRAEFEGIFYREKRYESNSFIDSSNFIDGGLIAVIAHVGFHVILERLGHMGHRKRELGHYSGRLYRIDMG
jgi:hypothetical protein